jgi:hypothetical protein
MRGENLRDLNGITQPVRFKPLDGIITGAFILVVILFSIFLFFTNSKGQTGVLVIQSPDAEYRFSMSEDRKIEIPGRLGSSVIEIHDGRFCMIHSPCQNHICMNMGWISYPNIPVICLPNRVSARITDSQESEQQFDGLSR